MKVLSRLLSKLRCEGGARLRISLCRARRAARQNQRLWRAAGELSARPTPRSPRGRAARESRSALGLPAWRPWSAAGRPQGARMAAAAAAGEKAGRADAESRASLRVLCAVDPWLKRHPPLPARSDHRCGLSPARSARAMLEAGGRAQMLAGRRGSCRDNLNRAAAAAAGGAMPAPRSPRASDVGWWAPAGKWRSTCFW